VDEVDTLFGQSHNKSNLIRQMHDSRRSQTCIAQMQIPLRKPFLFFRRYLRLLHVPCILGNMNNVSWLIFHSVTHPCPTNAAAIAAPRPDAPPVIRMFLSFNLFVSIDLPKSMTPVMVSKSVRMFIVWAEKTWNTQDKSRVR